MTTKTNIIKTAIVEDDVIVREGLQMFLNNSPGLSCTAVYSNGEDAVIGLPSTKPDVVLMDINLGGITGIDCIRTLNEMDLSMRFIMLTVFEDTAAIFKSLSSGASGYLLKHTAPEELLEAIQDVYRGGSPMSSEIARKVVDSFRSTVPAPPPGISYGLTKREEEVLSFLAKGYLYKEIADLLFISIDTVRSHIRHIYEKLQVKTRFEAISKYNQK